MEALSLGADDLAGTPDDGEIYQVGLYLNGQLHASLEDNETNTTGVGEYYDFNLSASLTSGEYWMEVVAEDVNGLKSRAERMIVLSATADDNISIISPAIGEPLSSDEVVSFDYNGTSGITQAYLEINGRIPWRGRLAFEGLDLPNDESNLTLSDGTGRGTITFEFDSNGYGCPPAETDSSIEELVANFNGPVNGSTYS